ncbi:hypothetical protein DNX30_23455 [Escherichia coli]|uniref:Uncharacterized protein n=1 Tax=Escherichia coli TaxID=562 RepID=A0A3R0NFQ9_ECOLX|nr:hypothetical protein [Escherichia albertii]EGI9627946.1 hypothetical protein [Escherichia coli]EIK7908578.1 hypothetical protein [Escherichia coli]EIY1626736.1 hypothetical protein [Escherichia coli]EIY8635623.1 hypothetical protein [Escherichia coli]MBB8574170.1 hypothetical protein [Escherichia coli]
MIAILNNAKGRVGVNAQAVIMVFLGLIVAKLYPDWWKGALATVSIYLLLSVVKRSFAKTVNQAKHFSFKNLINYITGLIFCLSILITSAFLPVSIANFFGAPYEVGYLFSVLCLVLALLYLWMRAKNKN